MFVVSLALNRRRWLSLGMFLLLAFAISVSFALPPAAISISATERYAATAQDRLSFLRSLGYEVSETAEEVQELHLPDELDATLLEYEALQQTASMSLAPYCGKRVRVYSYSIINAEEAATAHLYVYRDRVVAGDITSERSGGFCLALLPKTKENSEDATALG